MGSPRPRPSLPKEEGEGKPGESEGNGNLICPIDDSNKTSIDCIEMGMAALTLMEKKWILN